MGGIGSGNYYRWNKNTTIEETHHIDIRFLKKQNYLTPGFKGSLHWSCGGEQTGWIKFQTLPDSLRLMYRHRQNGGDWIDADEHIQFDWTPCNYGGKRQWFICPHCGERVAIVYGLSSRFLCRHCYDLKYSSQSEAALDRMIRKARKIRKRLNAGSEFYNKPKGMHWRTYKHLSEQEREITSTIDTTIYNLSHLLI